MNPLCETKPSLWQQVRALACAILGILVFGIGTLLLRNIFDRFNAYAQKFGERYSTLWEIAARTNQWWAGACWALLGLAMCILAIRMSRRGKHEAAR